MNEYKKWQAEQIAQSMAATLADKGYDARYAGNLAAARELVISMVAKGATVALGGSETLKAMGLGADFWRGDDYRFFDRYQKIPFAETVEIYRKSMLADFLITGTNAITKDGRLVNMDSSGNRAAGIIFGPKRVIVVAGANKVVDNLDEAMARIAKIAPMNARRVKHSVACAESGVCENCESAQSVCNAVSILNHGRKFPGRVSVIMIGEEAGF